MAYMISLMEARVGGGGAARERGRESRKAREGREVGRQWRKGRREK